MEECRKKFFLRNTHAQPRRVIPGLFFFTSLVLRVNLAVSLAPSHSRSFHWYGKHIFKVTRRFIQLQLGALVFLIASSVFSYAYKRSEEFYVMCSSLTHAQRSSVRRSIENISRFIFSHLEKCFLKNDKFFQDWICWWGLKRKVAEIHYRICQARRYQWMMSSENLSIHYFFISSKMGIEPNEV